MKFPAFDIRFSRKSPPAAETEKTADLPAESPLPPSASPSAPNGLIDALEGDILKVLSAVAQSAQSAHDMASRSRGEIEVMRTGMARLAENGRGAAADVISLASATEELTSISRDISTALLHTNDEIEDATTAAKEAARLIVDLSEATREIGSVLKTIADVARQTNLLALNATIEAARAGENGRGFAVVANEVKGLAAETREATKRIGQRVERLSASAGASNAAVQSIVDIIGRIKPRFTRVESSVAEQIEAIAGLARRSADTSGFVATVSNDVAVMDEAAAAATSGFKAVNTVAEEVAALTGDLGRRFVMVVREAELGNRRRDPRYPVALPVRVAGSRLRLTTFDLSRGGLRLSRRGAEQLPDSIDGEAEIDGLGKVKIRVVATLPTTLHCAFVEPGTDFLMKLDALIADRAAHYARLIVAMQQCAGGITSELATAIKSGALRERDLFEPDYVKIQGTEPDQFETPALRLLEALLPRFQDGMLKLDPKIAFCVAVDLHGYLPVHHGEYSQPQRPGQRAWNIAHCRNKRIFDDRFGIFAVRAMQPFVIQTYLRDMGEKKVPMASLDVPLRIADRPWGGLRLGYYL